MNPTDTMTPDLDVTISHHGQPMRYVGSSARWSGDTEITETRFECDCGLSVTVVARELVPRPRDERPLTGDDA